jgi:hypothetical protein
MVDDLDLHSASDDEQDATREYGSEELEQEDEMSEVNQEHEVDQEPPMHRSASGFMMPSATLNEERDTKYHMVTDDSATGEMLVNRSISPSDPVGIARVRKR